MHRNQVACQPKGNGPAVIRIFNMRLRATPPPMRIHALHGRNQFQIPLPEYTPRQIVTHTQRATP